MRKFLVSFALLASTISLIYAQDYKNSFGLRAGFSSGINTKYFFSPKEAVEIILIMRRGGFNVTGLYEKHHSSFASGLNYFYGGGAHLGFSYSDLLDNITFPRIIGIDGVIGLEYAFSNIPLCFSLDWKPALNLIVYSAFRGTEFALSFRYIF